MTIISANSWSSAAVVIGSVIARDERTWVDGGILIIFFYYFSMKTYILGVR